MDIKARFEGLSKSAYLDVLLPKAPHFDAAALIRDGAADELARAPARRNLFFGTSPMTKARRLQLTEIQVSKTSKLALL